MGMGIDWFFLSIFIDYYVIFRNCVNDLDINVFVMMYKFVDYYFIIIKFILCFRCFIFENDINFL